MKKSKKLSNGISFHKFLFISTCFAFFFVILLSIGYSSSSVTLEIEGDALVRADIPVRFINNSIKNLDNDGTEKASSKYTVDTITNHVELPNCDSIASYNVTIQNYSDDSVVIKSLDKELWNNDNIDYEVIGYAIGEEEIPASSEKTFEVRFKKITCDSDNNRLDSTLKLVLGKKYKVKYYSSIEPYSNDANPQSIYENNTLVVNFNGLPDDKIGVKVNGKSLYTGKSYTCSSGEVSALSISDGNVVLTNVCGDVTFYYFDSVNIYLGTTDSYYKAAPYNTLVESIEFVDYINLANADVSWDISVDQSGLAYAWIEGTSLYIGSEFMLYSEDLSNAFYNMNVAKKLEFNDKLDTSFTSNMKSMFYACRKVQSLDVSSFDTSNVTNMSGMFNSVSTISTLDVSNFDTSNVTDMSSMFMSLSNVTNLNISGFNTKKVTNMSGMFYGETKLANLDVSPLDTSSVKDMSRMFYGNSSLLSLNLSNFNTSNVTTFISMFYNCKKLTSLDLSSFNTSKVISFDGMFNSCTLLSDINVSSFSTIKGNSFSNMFKACTSLVTLDLSSFSSSTVKIMDGMFYNDAKLTTIYVSENWSTTAVIAGKGENLFFGCSSLSGKVPYEADKVSVDYANTDYYLTLKQ